jgi:hypothetical protein
MFSLAGCKCGHSLEHPPRTLNAAPAALDFGDVPLGQQLHLTLTVSAGASPVSVQPRVDVGAFTVATAPFDLQAGASQKLDVVFAPVALGAASATVSFLGADQPLTDSLSGNGVPACAQPATCHQVTFDPIMHACVDSMLPEHSPCQGLCIAGGECRSGSCVGTANACDDGNPCTDDSCSTEDGGCLHLAHICPVTNACRTAVCLADAGCTEAPVPDGTPCGDADCLQADVCLANACVTLPTPGGTADCIYTSIAGSPASQSCATTVSGKLRCWGAWRAPHTVAGSGNASRVAAASLLGYSPNLAEGACTVDTSGFDVRCFGFAGPDGGLGAPVRELDPPCAVLEDDRYVCWDLVQGQVTTLATGVRSATLVNGADGLGYGKWVRCLLLTDGGFDCTANMVNHVSVKGDAPFTSAPNRFLVPAVSDGVCAEWADQTRCRAGYVTEENDGGLSLDWFDAADLDAGLIAGGGGWLAPGLVANGNGVAREDGSQLFSVANPVVQLTSTERWAAPCLLNDQREVWCWGTDREGGLGLLTGNPHGLQR